MENQTCPVCRGPLTENNWMENPVVSLPFNGKKQIIENCDEWIGMVEIHCYGGAGDLGICQDCQRQIIINALEYIERQRPKDKG